VSENSILIVDCLEGALADFYYERMAAFAPEGWIAPRLRAMSGEFPADVPRWLREQGARAAIIGGSLHSPLDSDLWIRGLEEFARGFADAGLPALAICFGHEVLASALGGALARRDEHTVASREVRISAPDDPLFYGLGPTTRQLVAHEVMVSAPPPGFDVIASTGDCPVQAMKMRGASVYGVQFHPEVGPGVDKFDPDWAIVSDADFAAAEGAAVMKNFAAIVAGG